MAFDLSTAKPVAKGGFNLATAKPVKAEESGGFFQGAGNVAAGLIRGAGSIGATILTPYDMAVGNTQSWGNPERRADMDFGLQDMGAQPESWMYKGGKLAGEIAGTAGGGSLLAKGLTTVAPAAVSNAPRVAQLLEALKSGGFTLGSKSATLGGKAGDLGIRAAGGASAGASQAGLLDPTEAGLGAVIGGALPGGVQAVGGAAGVLGNAVRFVKRPPETQLANKLAQSLGMTPKELVGTLQPGPMPLNNLPGYAATVPQILQNPVSSQLQRTLKTAGANALGDAERVQQGAFRSALEGVAPIDISVQDAANRAGSAIQGYAIPARSQATQRVRDAFEAVDPFNESALYLPIKEMQAQQGKYLGEGTFGTGGKAAEAIATAKRIGTIEIPAVAPLARETANNSQTLEQAVRSAGGIRAGSRGGSGELRDLGIRQSGTTGLVNNKTGQSADLLAEQMYQRGYIPDADPSTLMDALRNGGGRKVFASDQVENNAMQRMAEAAMGDVPGATTINKAVPFQTVQNLRSSIGEAAEMARLKGANKEAAALEQMVGEVDSRINRAAGGSAGEGEFFPKEMADQYREALKLHADKMKKFETGPQMGMFRKGGDGQASIQGAEIPGKFYSGRRSQVEDVQSLKRLLGDQPALMDEMKRYAVTEGAGTSNVAGDLTSKFSKWLQSRSGANAELFNAKENATLREVGKAVERGINAENLGRVSGSDTAQKLEALNNLGLLDSKTVSVLATRIPGIGAFTGPMLSSLKETAGQARNNALSKMLANPDDLAKALKPGTSQSNALLEWMNRSGSAGSKVIYPLVGGGGQ
jgi:hypothetical protein